MRDEIKKTIKKEKKNIKIAIKNEDQIG